MSVFVESVAEELRRHPALANLTISLGLDPDEIGAAVPSMGSAVLGGLVGAADAYGSTTPLADALLISPYESVPEALSNLNELQSAGNELLDGLFRDKRGRAVIAIAHEADVPTSAVGRLFPFVAPAIVAGLRAHVRRTGLSAQGLLDWIRLDLDNPSALEPNPDPQPDLSGESAIDVLVGELDNSSTAGEIDATDPDLPTDFLDVTPPVEADEAAGSDESGIPVDDASSLEAENEGGIPVQANDIDVSVEAVEAAGFDHGYLAENGSADHDELERSEPGSTTLAELVASAMGDHRPAPDSAGPEQGDDAPSSGDLNQGPADDADESETRPGSQAGITPESRFSDDEAQWLASLVEDTDEPVPPQTLAEAVPPTGPDLTDENSLPPPSTDGLSPDVANQPGMAALAEVAEPNWSTDQSPANSVDLVEHLKNGPTEVDELAAPSVLGSELVPVPVDPVEQLRGFPFEGAEELEPVGSYVVPVTTEPDPQPVAEEYRDIDHLREHGEREASEAKPEFSNLAWVWWAVSAVALVLIIAMVLALAGSS